MHCVQHRHKLPAQQQEVFCLSYLWTKVYTVPLKGRGLRRCFRISGRGTIEPDASFPFDIRTCKASRSCAQPRLCTASGLTAEDWLCSMKLQAGAASTVMSR